MDERDERRRRLVRTWPLYGLRVVTPRVELRFPDDDDLAELAEAAAGGVHDPATMPFAFPWTDAAPPALQQNLLRHHWRQRAAWHADEWGCLLVLVVDGELVGAQDLIGSSFAVTRTVTTGSWVCRRLHRRGLGSEMRAAVLHLAFAGLGAERACSSAWVDNPARSACRRRSATGRTAAGASSGGARRRGSTTSRSTAPTGRRAAATTS